MVLPFHLAPKNCVQFLQGIEGHFLHFHQDMHGDDLHMTFYIGFPARFPDLGRQHYRSVVLGPGLKLFVNARVDPILVLGNSNLTVVRGNGLRDSAKVGQCVIVDTDPVADIAIGKSLDVEVVAERERGNEDRNRSQVVRITAVVDDQRFSGVIQFCIDSGITLDMEGDILVAHPVCIPPAILPVAERPFPVYFALCVV